MGQSERVATLIANPVNPVLSAELADRAREVAGASAVYFLADGVACDIPLPVDIDSPLEKLREAVLGQPVDCVVQKTATRRKKALLADMDSTLIEQECIDELAAEAGIGERVAEITASAMRGDIAFQPALEERVSLLAGQCETIIDCVLENRITLMPGSRELVATMKSNGAYCALVSGGFTQFTSRVAEALGFDEHRANTFDVEKGKFTGKVIPPVLGLNAKVEALEDVCMKNGLQPDDVIAVGDGANDLGMLSLAGSGGGAPCQADRRRTGQNPDRPRRPDCPALPTGIPQDGFRGVKPGYTLETDRLTIRNWTDSEEDRAFLHLIMSNETGRRFYPDRKTREQSDEVMDRILGWQKADELGWAVACLKDTGRRLGFTGLAPVEFDVPFSPTVEIGWQYDPATWGNGYATEAAGELLRHAFEDLALPEIVAFAIEENTASTAVMARIGMTHCPDETFIHPKVPETHPQLKRHVLWRITRNEWRERA